MKPGIRYTERTLTIEEDQATIEAVVGGAYANIAHRAQAGAPRWSNTVVDLRGEFNQYREGNLSAEQVAMAVVAKVEASPWNDMHLNDPETSTFRDALGWLRCVTEEDEVDAEMLRLWDVADVDRVRLLTT